MPYFVGQVYIKGIMLGRSYSQFDPDSHLTRAEASAIIMRMLDPLLRNPPAIAKDYE
jgi:hypothetical protein